MSRPKDNLVRPSFRRGLVIIVVLIAVFPVGLYLLFRWNWPARRWKYPVAGLFAVVFVANLHCFQQNFLYFDGAMHPRLRFRPDAFSGWRPEPGAATGTITFPEQIDADAQWPGFRGRFRDGLAGGPKLALPWPTEGPKLMWKHPVGGGYASFAVFGGAAYTIEQRGDNEVVSCYAVRDGREVWVYAYRAGFEEALGGNGPRATPAVQDGRVYGLGATGVLTCLDAATGKLIWKRNILQDASAKNLRWGQSASPLVYGGKVIVVPGGPKASVVAYEAETGRIAWTTGTNRAAYSSPMIARLQGFDQLLVFDAAGLSAYGPDDGRALWNWPWRTDWDINVAQPVVVDEARVCIGSGYGVGSAMLRLSRSNRGFAVEKVWANRNLKPKFTSAVLYEDHIYGLDGAILVCLDLDGNRCWKSGRYGYGQLILADGYLIIQCENGDLALVEASPRAHRLISRVKAIRGKTWNHPALADGKLLIRNDREMAGFDLTAGPVR